MFRNISKLFVFICTNYHSRQIPMPGSQGYSKRSPNSRRGPAKVEGASGSPHYCAAQSATAAQLLTCKLATYCRRHKTRAVGQAGGSQSTHLPAIPPEFFCPITHELMLDPVTTSDGHSYDRAAIQARLRPAPCSQPSAAPSAALRARVSFAIGKHHDERAKHRQGRRSVSSVSAQP